MSDYDYEKIREYYHSFAEVKKVFDEHPGNIEENLVNEYEDLMDQAGKELPGLLKEFDKQNYFSHNNGPRSIYYRSEGIKAHIGRNLGILKVKLDSTTQTPVTETKSFHFITEDDLRKILERDFLEIQRSIISANWKSAIILSGSSVETILLDLLQKNESTAKLSSKAPSETSLSRWDLSDLIEVAVDADLVDKSVAKLSHSVREYRNLVHPGAEIRSKLKVEPEEAKIAVEVLNILIRELS